MDVHPTKNGINRYWSIPICIYIYICNICLSHVMVDACYPGPISCGKSLALPTNGPVRSACYLDPDGPMFGPLFEGPCNQKATGRRWSQQRDWVWTCRNDLNENTNQQLHQFVYTLKPLPTSHDVFVHGQRSTDCDRSPLKIKQFLSRHSSAGGFTKSCYSGRLLAPKANVIHRLLQASVAVFCFPPFSW